MAMIIRSNGCFERRIGRQVKKRTMKNILKLNWKEYRALLESIYSEQQAFKNPEDRPKVFEVMTYFMARVTEIAEVKKGG